MDPLLAVIIVLGVALLAACVYMEWLGLLSIATFRSGQRHTGCGHRKLTPANGRDFCWRCRHQHLEHAIHAIHH